MQRLHPELLDDFNPLLGRDANFHATLKARGLYNTFHFVLRLSPAVHRKLGSMPSGIVESSQVDLEGLEAFSTLLHETIHWWQHIGSTYGLMLSLTYPTQAHANYNHLRNLISQLGFQKSIRDLADKLPDEGLGTPSGLVNIIINNHYDVEAFRELTVMPKSAAKIAKNPLFENVGHAYQMAYANNLIVLSSVADTAFNVIPHPQRWSQPFDRLRDGKEDGFYYGSPIRVPPVGAYEIFEGQARMAQLQYLHFATEGSIDFADEIVARMLEGVYRTAFDCFLEAADLDHPKTIDDPTVALFLLICDVAINPGSGFPFPLIHFPSFVSDVDPGMRFIMLSRMIHLKCPHVARAIRNYSRAEYELVSQTLAEAMIEWPPLKVAEEFCRWADTREFQQLMNEYDTFNYSQGNIVPRVLLSHFLQFMRDKQRVPEYFCWPGPWMAGKRITQEAVILFDRHGALFVDKADDDSIFPRLRPDRVQGFLQETFDSFYAMNLTYDLTRQWITERGPFKYDYSWLSQSGSYEDIEGFATRAFKSVYGVNPKEAVLIKIDV